MFLLLFIVLQLTAMVLANDKLDKTRLRDDSCGFGRRAMVTGLVVEEVEDQEVGAGALVEQEEVVVEDFTIMTLIYLLVFI